MYVHSLKAEEKPRKEERCVLQFVPRMSVGANVDNVKMSIILSISYSADAVEDCHYEPIGKYLDTDCIHPTV